jgi:hypothetical protein
MSDVNPPPPEPPAGDNPHSTYSPSNAQDQPSPGAGSAQASAQRPAGPEPLWVRALYMVLFGLIANFLLAIYLASCVLQIIVIAVSQKPNSELREFLRNVLAYIGVTLAYLAFLDDQKPFPFSPFPHPVRDTH